MRNKIQLLLFLNCFTKFPVFIVSVFNIKNVSKLLKIAFKLIFCHLIPILKIQIKYKRKLKKKQFKHQKN